MGGYDDPKWDWSLGKDSPVGPGGGSDLQEEAPDRGKQN